MAFIKFNSLRIKNFKKIKSFVFDFEAPKFLLIEGPNGAGKTSILDAVVYVLYGETLRASRRVREAVVPTHAPEKVPSVELDFSISNIGYLIKRSLSKVEIYKNNELYLKSQQARSFILNTFGDKMRFVNQCLIAPKTARRLFLPNLSNTERFLFFKSITELDFLEKAYELVEEDLKKLEKEKLSVENALQYGIDASFNVELKALAEKEKLYTQQLNEARSDIVNVQDTLNKLKETKEEVKKAQSKITNLQKERKEVNDKLTKIRKELRDKTRELAEAETQVKEALQKKVSAVEKELSEIDRKLSALEKQKAQKVLEIKEEQSASEKKAIEDIAREKEKASSKLSEIASKAETYSASFSEISAKLQQRKAEAERLRTALTKRICSECKRPYDSATYRREQEEKIKQLEKSIDSMKRSLKLVSTQRKKLQEEKERIEAEVKKQEKQLNEKLNEISKSTERKIAKIEDTHNKEKNELLSKASQIEIRIKLLKKKEADALATDKKLLTLKKEIYNLEEDEEALANRLEKIQAELNVLQEAYSLAAVETREKDALEAKKRLEDKVIELKSNLEKLKQERKVLLEKYKNSKNETEKKLKEITENIQVTEFWKKSFKKDLNVFLLKERLQRLEDISNNLSEEMTSPIEFQFYVDTSKKIPSLELDAFHRDVKSHLENFSVGETALYSFILLRSLSIFLEQTYSSRYNFVFYDEVLDSLDSYNIEELLYQLREEARSGKCVSIISHIKSIKDFDYFDDTLSIPQ